MEQRTNQVQQWRDFADDAHPAGPLFTAGAYAEADITMSVASPTAMGCTGNHCSVNCSGQQECKE